MYGRVLGFLFALVVVVCQETRAVLPHEGLDDQLPTQAPAFLKPSLRSAEQQRLLTILILGTPEGGTFNPDFPVHPQAFTEARAYPDSPTVAWIQHLFPDRSPQMLRPNAYRGDPVAEFSLETLGKFVRAIWDNRTAKAPWATIVDAFFPESAGVTDGDVTAYNHHLHHEGWVNRFMSLITFLDQNRESLAEESNDTYPVLEAPLADWYAASQVVPEALGKLSPQDLETYERLRRFNRDYALRQSKKGHKDVTLTLEDPTFQATYQDFLGLKNQDKALRARRFRNLLVQALEESDHPMGDQNPWPQFMPERALTQYAWRRVRNLESILPFYEALGMPLDFDQAQPFTFKAYEKARDWIKAGKTLPLETTANAVQGYGVYEDPKGMLFPTGTVSFDGKRFADCADVSVLNLLMQMIRIQKEDGTMTYDPDKIPLRSNIREYLKRHLDGDTLGTQDARDEWGAMMARIPGVAYLTKTKKVPDCEIKPGVLNLVRVLTHVMDLETPPVTPETLKGTLETIATNLTNSERTVVCDLEYLETDTTGDEVYDDLTFILTHGDKPPMDVTWSIQADHAKITAESADWRLRMGAPHLTHDPNPEQKISSDWRQNILLKQLGNTDVMPLLYGVFNPLRDENNAFIQELSPASMRESVLGVPATSLDELEEFQDPAFMFVTNPVYEPMRPLGLKIIKVLGGESFDGRGGMLPQKIQELINQDALSDGDLTMILDANPHLLTQGSCRPETLLGACLSKGKEDIIRPYYDRLRQIHFGLQKRYGEQIIEEQGVLSSSFSGTVDTFSVDEVRPERAALLKNSQARAIVFSNHGDNSPKMFQKTSKILPQIIPASCERLTVSGSVSRYVSQDGGLRDLLRALPPQVQVELNFGFHREQEKTRFEAIFADLKKEFPKIPLKKDFYMNPSRQEFSKDSDLDAVCHSDRVGFLEVDMASGDAAPSADQVRALMARFMDKYPSGRLNLITQENGDGYQSILNEVTASRGKPVDINLTITHTTQEKGDLRQSILDEVTASLEAAASKDEPVRIRFTMTLMTQENQEFYQSILGDLHQSILDKFAASRGEIVGINLDMKVINQKNIPLYSFTSQASTPVNINFTIIPKE